jgi:hypothetical protein
LLWLFGDEVSGEVFARAGLKPDPLDLSLPSSWDYRQESPVLGSKDPS